MTIQSSSVYHVARDSERAQYHVEQLWYFWDRSEGRAAAFSAGREPGLIQFLAERFFNAPNGVRLVAGAPDDVQDDVLGSRWTTPTKTEMDRIVF